MTRSVPNSTSVLLISFSLVLATLLVGCTPRLEVVLASDQESIEAPRFEVSERKRAAPRYDSVSVLNANGDEVWHVRADPFKLTNQPSGITYGRTPDGFEVLTEAQALEPGKLYRLVVQGKGVGVLSFEGAPDGIVHLVD